MTAAECLQNRGKIPVGSHPLAAAAHRERYADRAR
jgi:hypothetical protein